MEDLPLGRTAALVSEFAMIDLPLGKKALMLIFRGRKIVGLLAFWSRCSLGLTGRIFMDFYLLLVQ